MRIYEKKPTGVWYLELQRGKAVSLRTKSREEAEEKANLLYKKEDKFCAYCGKTLTGRSYRFCDGSCKKNYQSEMSRFGDLRANILAGDNFACYFCTSSEDLVLHHIDGNGTTKKAEDRNNSRGNIVTLCASCHSKLHRVLG